MKEILFVSNGHGEDAITKMIIKRLKEKERSLDISVLPLVGSGKLFEGDSIKILGPRRELPSGGFSTLDIPSFFADVGKGLFPVIFEEMRTLLRTDADIYVSVGDIYPLIFILLFGKRKKIHVGTAISSYMREHFKFEEWLMGRCSHIFSRDNYTAECLKKAGMPATFAGNVMMDFVSNVYSDFDVPPQKTVIGILPSSRPEAYLNIIHMLEIADEIVSRKKEIVFLLSLAPTLDIETLRKKIEKANYYYKTDDAGTLDEIVTRRGGTVKVVVGYLSETINRSKMILGMTGTGCEQAAGLGKPVVIPIGLGVSTSRLRTELYKRLLGESILTIEGKPQKIAEEVLALLKNEKKIARMGSVGRDRMGGPGGAEKIAEVLLKL